MVRPPLDSENSEKNEVSGWVLSILDNPLSSHPLTWPGLFIANRLFTVTPLERSRCRGGLGANSLIARDIADS